MESDNEMNEENEPNVREKRATNSDRLPHCKEKLKKTVSDVEKQMK